MVVSVLSWEFVNGEILAGFSRRQRAGVITEMDGVLKLLFRRYEKLRSRMRSAGNGIYPLMNYYLTVGSVPKA